MITFIADVHVDNYAKWGGADKGGLNDRAKAVLSTLTNAVHNTRGPIVVLGDLFNRCQPTPTLIARVQEIFSKYASGSVTLLIGNHDQESGHLGHNALAPLAPVAKIIEKPTSQLTANKDLLFVPFQPGPAKDWLPDVVDELCSRTNTWSSAPVYRGLCLHMGLSDEATPYYLDATAGSINVRTLAGICNKNNITHVFAGDWHRHQTWKIDGVVMVQVGALCPNRFPPAYDQADIGPMVIWDGYGKDVVVHNVPGPRFYKLRWSQVANSGWLPGSDASPAFVKLTYRSDQAEEARTWGSSLAVEMSLRDSAATLGGIEYEVDRGIEVAKARTASFEARQAHSLEEALRLYVDKMPVDKGVSRETVLKHVRRLLG